VTAPPSIQRKRLSLTLRRGPVRSISAISTLGLGGPSEPWRQNHGALPRLERNEKVTSASFTIRTDFVRYSQIRAFLTHPEKLPIELGTPITAAASGHSVAGQSQQLVSLQAPPCCRAEPDNPGEGPGEMALVREAAGQSDLCQVVVRRFQH
jgi:hypothetical protein